MRTHAQLAPGVRSAAGAAMFDNSQVGASRSPPVRLMPRARCRSTSTRARSAYGQADHGHRPARPMRGRSLQLEFAPAGYPGWQTLGSTPVGRRGRVSASRRRSGNRPGRESMRGNGSPHRRWPREPAWRRASPRSEAAEPACPWPRGSVATVLDGPGLRVCGTLLPGRRRTPRRARRRAPTAAGGRWRAAGPAAGAASRIPLPRQRRGPPPAGLVRRRPAQRAAARRCGGVVSSST